MLSWLWGENISEPVIEVKQDERPSPSPALSPSPSESYWDAIKDYKGSVDMFKFDHDGVLDGAEKRFYDYNKALTDPYESDLKWLIEQIAMGNCTSGLFICVKRYSDIDFVIDIVKISFKFERSFEQIVHGDSDGKVALETYTLIAMIDGPLVNYDQILANALIDYDLDCDMKDHSGYSNRIVNRVDRVTIQGV
jgi:hypothetical protein